MSSLAAAHYQRWPPTTSHKTSSFLEAQGRTLQLSLRPLSQSQSQSSSQSTHSSQHTERTERFRDPSDDEDDDDEFDCGSEFEQTLLDLDPDHIVANQRIDIQQTASFRSAWTSSQSHDQPEYLDVAPPVKNRVSEYLDKWLTNDGPFSTPTGDPARDKIPFHMNYEVARVAIHTKISHPELMMVVHDVRKWEFVEECLKEAVKCRQKKMPERSHVDFKSEPFDWDCVTPGGKLVMVSDQKKNDKPFFEFQVKPLMRRQKSHRFARKFGSDRFFELDVPWPTRESLPEALKQSRSNLDDTREYVMEWLYGQSHNFLGRTWRALFPKPSERRSKVMPGEERKNIFKVYFFAEKGIGIQRQDEMPLFKIMDWFFSVGLNLNQPSLKLFARLRMGLSTTTPTVVFQPHQIMRTRDAYSSSPGLRSLNADMHVGFTQHGGYKDLGEVMNDGCARISKTAHEAIAVMLGFARPYPSTFQARIGGAKGMWMVDLLDEKTPVGDDFWIEITDSQLKFETDPIVSDEFHRTFEVCGFPSNVLAADLNVQLINVLADRGVPSLALENLMQESLTAEVNGFNEAMENPGQVPSWIFSRNRESLREERIRAGALKMLGGIPLSNAERSIMLVNSGFEPNQLQYLRTCCQSELTSYLRRLAEKLSINVGQSTNVIMLADPLGILCENEVHLGFSSSFVDKISGFDSIFLDDMDILVARSPANLPSDIQKVRAVFKKRLAKYKDVIIFPSYGPSSLASKLSGGDYDGDIAWVCWDQRIVQPFQSVEPPPTPEPETYGITKDRTKVSDIYYSNGFIHDFIMRGLKLNSIQSQLGIASNYRDRLVYHRNNISDPDAVELAGLLSHLVDASKGGLTFTTENFRDWKKSKKLKMEYGKPAYKDEHAPQNITNILDKLAFNVVRKMMGQVKHDFAERAKEIPTYDADLTTVWKAEEERATKDPALKAILLDLCAQFEPLWKHFTDNCKMNDGSDVDPYATKKKSKPSAQFPAIHQLRQMFLDIQPLGSSSSSSTIPSSSRPHSPLKKQEQYHMLPLWQESRGIYADTWLLIISRFQTNVSRNFMAHG